MRNMELKIGLSNGGFGAERFVASLFALTSFGSLNSGYAVRYRSPKPLRVSHTRETLYAICLRGRYLEIETLINIRIGDNYGD